ncbi:hypothetical protein BDR26DRAFT_895626 [Obelidium mucronatum]|nr:hypothetical protein BDR26DRAFT_895626 [Obelidium mucronatum]
MESTNKCQLCCPGFVFATNSAIMFHKKSASHKKKASAEAAVAFTATGQLLKWKRTTPPAGPALAATATQSLISDIVSSTVMPTTQDDADFDVGATSIDTSCPTINQATSGTFCPQSNPLHIAPEDPGPPVSETASNSSTKTSTMSAINFSPLMLQSLYSLDSVPTFYPCPNISYCDFMQLILPNALCSTSVLARLDPAVEGSESEESEEVKEHSPWHCFIQPWLVLPISQSSNATRTMQSLKLTAAGTLESTAYLDLQKEKVVRLNEAGNLEDSDVTDGDLDSESTKNSALDKRKPLKLNSSIPCLKNKSHFANIKVVNNLNGSDEVFAKSIALVSALTIMKCRGAICGSSAFVQYYEFANNARKTRYGRPYLKLVESQALISLDEIEEEVMIIPDFHQIDDCKKKGLMDDIFHFQPDLR